MDNEIKTVTKRIPLFFYASFILMLLALIGLTIMVKSMNATLKKQREVLLQLPPELHSKIEAQFQSSADFVKERIVGVHAAASVEIKKDAEKQFELQRKLMQKLVDQIAGNQKQFELQKKQVITIHSTAAAGIKADAKQLFELQENRLQKQMAQIIATQNQLQSELAKLNRDIESVVQASKKNHEDAEAAIAMAKKTAESGEMQLAIIYALNAINHESSNADYLKFYYKLLAKKKNLAISDIDQFTAVLDLAVFQINAVDIQSVIEMKTALMKKRSSMVSAVAEAKRKEVAAQVASNIAELREGRLALTKISVNGNVNENLLKERMETLSALLADASLSQEDRNALSDDLRYATGLYSIVTTLSAVKNAISKADSLAEKKQLEPTEILTARNQLQTGNTLLSQIWSSDCTKYQELVTTAQKLQADIAATDKKLNLIASAPAKERIEKLIAECRSIAAENEKYTSRMDRITSASKEFSLLLAAVYDLELRKALAVEIETLSPLVSGLSKERYKAYQQWALGKLNDAREKWAYYTVITDGRARDMFNDYILEINPALLLPDVNSLYNNLYQLIYNELPDKEKAEWQYKKAISERVKQLEDF